MAETNLTVHEMRALNRWRTAEAKRRETQTEALADSVLEAWHEQENGLAPFMHRRKIIVPQFADGKADGVLNVWHGSELVTAFEVSSPSTQE